MKINYVLDENAFPIEKAHDIDAGIDIRCPIDKTVRAHDSAVIDTGVHVEIPIGFVGFLKSKSGLNVKHGLRGEGVIDAGYTGSIVVKMYNDSDAEYKFGRGDKLIQLVLLPIPQIELAQVTELGNTERGDNGFGSTGR